MRFLVLIILCGFSWLVFAIDESGQPPAVPTTQPVETAPSQEEPKNQVSNATPTAKQESEGKKTYERFCIVCHRDGLVGAPKFRDENAWKSRLSGKTMDQLVAIAIKGLNAMPAKGTCYECNEEDIKSAIEYMLPKS